MSPDAPKGSAVRTFIQSLAQMGVAYAGAINGGAGGKWACPIHDDAHPSLDVTVGRNGKPIFNCKPCHEAMGQAEFVAALREAGVSWSGAPCKPEDVDWGEASVYTRPSTKGGSKGEVALTARHEYRHADGSINFVVKRYDPVEGSEARKHFVPKHKVDGKGFVTGLDGVERTPYYLERFEEWISGPDTDGVITLVEGEKAADALVAYLDPATTFHGGTAGKTEPDWVTRYGFDRFKLVRLWPDADEAGVLRMTNLAADLRAAGVEYQYVGVLPCEPKDDAADLDLEAVQPLTDLDLDLLRAMHPMPKRVVKEKPQAAPAVLAPNGKAIVSALGWEAQETAVEPEEDDDLVEPYPVPVVQKSWEFTREFIDRNFRTDDGHLTLRVHHDDKQFWQWQGTRYVQLTDDQIGSVVGELLEGQKETVQGPPKDGVFPDPVVRPISVKSTVVAEVVKCLRLQTITAKIGKKALLPAEGGVPFLNGWLDAETGELQPLTPERDVRWNVQAAYDPKATCPEWFKFLDSIGWTKGTDERRVLRQWQGHLISGDTAIHKGVLLVGPKRAGKGTVLDICSALLGDGAIGIQLDSFAQNFGLQNLIGKGLATVGDARFSMRTDKAVIERLLSLTSFDAVQIDVKRKDPMNVRLGTRLMIASNETPKFIEASDALSTRFIVLEFLASFYGREDLGLARRLLKELPGIARWALGGLADLREQGRFHETARGLALQDQMIRDAAPIRVFVEECCVLGSDEWDESQDLFDRYLRWCEKANTYKMDRASFFRDLNTAYPGQIENLKKRIGGSPVPCKRGIRVR